MEPESGNMALYIEATERKRGWRPILAVRFIAATRYGIVVKEDESCTKPIVRLSRLIDGCFGQPTD